MKAIRYHRYGAPHVLELEDLEMPVVKDDEILVRVRAASVNPLDWHNMRGTPYVVRMMAGLRRPKFNGLAVDMAGAVEAVGKNVTAFAPGDEVFGWHKGTLAEYITVAENGVVLKKPGDLTFEQAASVPVAGLTALQGLRDKGRIEAGHKVLVNGAAGGVGTFAVQIAKALGAEVTGVCGGGNVKMVESIGADRVIDYTQEDYTRTDRRYDIVLDVAANRTLSESRRVLTHDGVLVGVGLASPGMWIGPLLGPVKMLLLSRLVSQRFAPFLARENRDDLAVLRDLLEAGKVTPVIDRTYTLSETPEAIGYLEEGHAKGKVVITL
ncbi:NAD(P)-dependent alcohol dehydrogenase [Spirillospora sp. NPDC048911]|uniref:NAD(P)-dependent alcohol dehydrogenase n=1 Tax=Spirillospora sp. NPDC048911 TaxID=3364527 RepID=UPI00371D112D